MKDASAILNEALNERKAVNPSYSLRAFARDIGLSPSQLSNVMNRRRGLGVETANEVAKSLELSPHEKLVFQQSLQAQFAQSKAQRIVARGRLKSLQQDQSSKQLDLDLFKTISNWHHFTLLELIKISPVTRNEELWFSEKLGIPENEVRLALGRLKRLGLIERSGGMYQVNQATVIADEGIPTDAIRKYHQQMLEKSLQALVFQGADERYGYSAAMPVKVKNLDRAKKLIQKFRMDFGKEVSNRDEGHEIYGLCVQFFRLTQKQKSGELK